MTASSIKIRALTTKSSQFSFLSSSGVRDIVSHLVKGNGITEELLFRILNEMLLQYWWFVSFLLVNPGGVRHRASNTIEKISFNRHIGYHHLVWGNGGKISNWEPGALGFNSHHHSENLAMGESNQWLRSPSPRFQALISSSSEIIHQLNLKF